MTIRRKFNLERVGQYLENKNLTSPIKTDITPKWDQLLAANECLRSCECIYPHNSELSLVQQHNLLKTSVTELFQKPEQLISEKFEFVQHIDCAEWLVASAPNVDQPMSTHTTHINIEDENVTMFAAVQPSQQMFFLEMGPNRIGGIRLAFQRKTVQQEQQTVFGELKFHHIQFFNEEILSMLFDNLVDGRVSNCFVQFPLAVLRAKLTLLSGAGDGCNLMDSCAVTNFYDILDMAMIKSIDGFDGNVLSVSGSRKVCMTKKRDRKDLSYRKICCVVCR